MQKAKVTLQITDTNLNPIPYRRVTFNASDTDDLSYSFLEDEVQTNEKGEVNTYIKVDQDVGSFGGECFLYQAGDTTRGTNIETNLQGESTTDARDYDTLLINRTISESTDLPLLEVHSGDSSGYNYRSRLGGQKKLVTSKEQEKLENGGIVVSQVAIGKDTVIQDFIGGSTDIVKMSQEILAIGETRAALWYVAWKDGTSYKSFRPGSIYYMTSTDTMYMSAGFGLSGFAAYLLPSETSSPRNAYSTEVSSQTTVSITATEHQLYTSELLVFCYRYATASDQYVMADIAIHNTTLAVTCTFAEAFTGKILIVRSPDKQSAYSEGYTASATSVSIPYSSHGFGGYYIGAFLLEDDGTSNIIAYPNEVTATPTAPGETNYNITIDLGAPAANNGTVLLIPFLKDTIDLQTTVNLNKSIYEIASEVTVGDFISQKYETMVGDVSFLTKTLCEIIGIYEDADSETIVVDGILTVGKSFNVIRKTETNTMLVSPGSQNIYPRFPLVLNQSFQETITCVKGLTTGQYSVLGDTITVYGVDYSWISNIPDTYITYEGSDSYIVDITRTSYDGTNTSIVTTPFLYSSTTNDVKIWLGNYRETLEKYIYPVEPYINITAATTEDSFSSNLVEHKVRIKNNPVLYEKGNYKPQNIYIKSGSDQIIGEQSRHLYITRSSVSNGQYFVRFKDSPNILTGDVIIQGVDSFKVVSISESDYFVDKAGVLVGYALVIRPIVLVNKNSSFDSFIETTIGGQIVNPLFLADSIRIEIRKTVEKPEGTELIIRRADDIKKYDRPLIVCPGDTISQGSTIGVIQSVYSEPTDSMDRVNYKIMVNEGSFERRYAYCQPRSTRIVYVPPLFDETGEKEILINNSKYGLIYLRDIITYRD